VYDRFFTDIEATEIDSRMEFDGDEFMNWLAGAVHE